MSTCHHHTITVISVAIIFFLSLSLSLSLSLFFSSAYLPTLKVKKLCEILFLITTVIIITHLSYSP